MKGTKNKSFGELSKIAFPVDGFWFGDQKYVFVVNRMRKFKEYQFVREQSRNKGQLGPYANSLFNSMFKGWKD